MAGIGAQGMALADAKPAFAIAMIRATAWTISLISIENTFTLIGEETPGSIAGAVCAPLIFKGLSLNRIARSFGHLGPHLNQLTISLTGTLSLSHLKFTNLTFESLALPR